MHDKSYYIEKLEALQGSMPPFEDLVAAMHGNFVQYDLDKGFAVGYGCLNDHDCAVQKLFVTGDAVFPQHAHGEYEFFIIIQGEGTAEIGDETREFKAKDLIVIPPGVAHRWHYKTPCKQIIVTIPASPGFPNE